MKASRRVIVCAVAVACALAAFRAGTARAGDDWLPVSPDELKMTIEPLAPGAPAIYLYRQVDRDDQAYHEFNYVRIKIFTEEGRKYADVEIPFVKGKGHVYNIKARTVQPDGSITNFDGKIYEKTVVKARGLKYLAKTFTLPEIRVGSIIEYRYTKDWEQYYVYDSHWILSEELFTKRAKFSLKQHADFAIRWSWPVGLPAGTTPPKAEGSTIRLETQNVPAFQIEDFMPPQDELKNRVDFVYSEESFPEKDPDKFWKSECRKEFGKVEDFVGKRKAMKQAVAQIVTAADAPEIKLQKVYARVQQIQNTSFEEEKTVQEEKREKRKDINNVEDAWRRGYANGRAITWLFLGLARAAGFEAYPVLVSRRSQYFFQRNLMNPNALNDNVVLVKVSGKDMYFDPGTAFTPYGLLPWAETGVQGLRLDKDGGTWVTTTLPPSSESRTERKAQLRLTDEGALEGKLMVTYTGLEALWRRMEERNEDEADRKKFLEDEVKRYVPAGIEVELTNKPVWSSSSERLTAEFSLKVPGWATAAGRRALIGVGLFGGEMKHLFEHSNRVHPIYFQFPFEEEDDLTIELPLGWQVSSLPTPQNVDANAVSYVVKAENKGGTLHVNRFVKNNVVLLEPKYYPTLRNFFQMVRTGDEQQIVLQPGVVAQN